MKFSKLFYVKLLMSLLVMGFVGFEIYKSLKDDQSKGSSVQYFKNQLQDVSAITIKAGRQQISFHLQGKKWIIEQPFKAEADSQMLNGILVQIQNSRTELIPSTHDINSEILATFGLDDPLAELKFTNHNQQIQSLSLSANKAYRGDSYLYLRDTKAKKQGILVSDYNWMELILKNVSAFLKQSDFIAISPEPLNRVEIDFVFLKRTSNNPQNVFPKIVYSKINNLWTISLGEPWDAASVNSLIKSVNTLKLSHYEEDPFILKKPNPIKKYMLISFKDQNDKLQELVFYDKFKSCDFEGKTSECQLLTFSSLPLPFWVDKALLKSLVEQDYLKK